MRYQRIFTSIWQDEKFLTLSEDGKLLFLYVLTSPHSNSLGLYVLPSAYILGDLGWDKKRLAKPFVELLGKGLVAYDESTRLIMIQNHLKHNPVENENQAKANAKLILKMPKSQLFAHVISKLIQNDKSFYEPLIKQLKEQLPKAMPEPIPVRFPKPKEREKINSKS